MFPAGVTHWCYPLVLPAGNGVRLLPIMIHPLTTGRLLSTLLRSTLLLSAPLVALLCSLTYRLAPPPPALLSPHSFVVLPRRMAPLVAPPTRYDYVMMQREVKIETQLTDEASFHDTVIKSNDIWIVDAMAPWCGPCQALKPTLRKLSSSMNGLGVRIAMVDCTTTRIAVCAMSTHYPSLWLFPRGPKAGVESAQLLTISREHGHGAAGMLHIFEMVVKATLAWSPPSKGEIRRRIARFYKKHNPAKLDELEEQFTKYAGREEALLEAIHKKYGVPLPKDDNDVEEDGVVIMSESWKDEL